MRTPAMLLAALVLTLATVSGCGDDGGPAVARDEPSASFSPEDGPPAAAVPDGPVRTADLAVVMDRGEPELCLGPVAESYPPQCSGPPVAGWDWAEHDGTYDEQGEVRWGTYALTGTWDGTSFTATDAISAALYDPASPEPTPTPSPATAYDDAQLTAIAEELAQVDGVQGAYGADGHVLVDVVYDDGTLQTWADEQYGAGVVLVTSALVDAG